jgi:hypothetical protein
MLARTLTQQNLLERCIMVLQSYVMRTVPLHAGYLSFIWGCDATGSRGKMANLVNPCATSICPCFYLSDRNKYLWFWMRFDASCASLCRNRNKLQCHAKFPTILLPLMSMDRGYIRSSICSLPHSGLLLSRHMRRSPNYRDGFMHNPLISKTSACPNAS